MVLPKSDYTTKNFMWSIVVGIKKCLTRGGDFNGLKYLEHNPGCTIKENNIRYWSEHINEFPGWEHYIPDHYIKMIKKQGRKSNIDNRQFIPFDTKYLLSVFKSLNYSVYAQILR